jgi:hypothetical protein
VTGACCFAGFAREDLQHYPYISSGDADLTPALTGLLTQQATWQMLQLKEEVENLVMRSAGSSSKILSRAVLLLPALLLVLALML